MNQFFLPAIKGKYLYRQDSLTFIWQQVEEKEKF